MNYADLDRSPAELQDFKAARLNALIELAKFALGGGAAVGALVSAPALLRNGTENDLPPLDDGLINIGTLKKREKPEIKAKGLPGFLSLNSRTKRAAESAIQKALAELMPAENVYDPLLGVWGPSLALGVGLPAALLGYNGVRKGVKALSESSRDSALAAAKKKYEKALQDEYMQMRQVKKSARDNNAPTTYKDVYAQTPPLDNLFAAVNELEKKAGATHYSEKLPPFVREGFSAWGHLLSNYSFPKEGPKASADSLLGAILASTLLSTAGAGYVGYNWGGDKTPEQLKKDILAKRQLVRSQTSYGAAPALFARAE